MDNYIIQYEIKHISDKEYKKYDFSSFDHNLGEIKVSLYTKDLDIPFAKFRTGLYSIIEFIRSHEKDPTQNNYYPDDPEKQDYHWIYTRTIRENKYIYFRFGKETDDLDDTFVDICLLYNEEFKKFIDNIKNEEKIIREEMINHAIKRLRYLSQPSLVDPFKNKEKEKQRLHAFLNKVVPNMSIEVGEP